jgi:hypothetical protein
MLELLIENGAFEFGQLLRYCLALSNTVCLDRQRACRLNSMQAALVAFYSNWCGRVQLVRIVEVEVCEVFERLLRFVFFVLIHTVLVDVVVFWVGLFLETHGSSGIKLANVFKFEVVNQIIVTLLFLPEVLPTKLTLKWKSNVWLLLDLFLWQIKHGHLTCFRKFSCELRIKVVLLREVERPELAEVVSDAVLL